MGVIITPQTKINEYFESTAIGQSRLKLLLKGFDNFLSSQQKDDTELYYNEKDYFIIGSAVDTILTGEEGEFQKQYYVSEIEKKPSDTEMSIINMIFDELIDNNVAVDMTLADYPNMLDNSIKEHSWYNGKPGEKRIAGLIERGKEYFEDLKAAFGKQVISKDQETIINNIVESLRTNSRTAKYFDRVKLKMFTAMDIYYQLPIYFEYKGINCKALLDILIVFKDDNGVPISVQPIDLKTMTGNTLSFLKNVKAHRYDIQGAWYTEALINENSSFNLDYNMEKAKVLPFMFIVESSNIPGRPLLYKMSENLLRVGKEGRPEIKLVDANNLFIDSDYKDYIIMREIRGFDSLIDEYSYYEKTGWKEHKLIEEKDGLLDLYWDRIS